MSLSERLRAAEQQRRVAAGLDDPSADEPVVDLTPQAGAVIDLTARLAPRPMAPGDLDGEATFQAGADGISYNPVRHGDASSSFGAADPLVADRSTQTPCPRCGGPTQIDLFDQVHQTASLSCLSCFHMFRVHADGTPESR